LALLGSGEIPGSVCSFKGAILSVLGCWFHSWTTLCLWRVHWHQPTWHVCTTLHTCSDRYSCLFYLF